MSHEEEVAKVIRDNLDSLSEKTDLDQDHIDRLVDECVSVDESAPLSSASLSDIKATPLSAQSSKPMNIIVGFDITTAFEILAQTGFLSGEPWAIFASVSAFCALVGNKTQIELNPETGFIYWIAYENRHELWEIPKEELIELVSNKSKSMDVPFELTKNEIECHIKLLCRYKSFKPRYKNGREYLILRERCSADWSK